MSRERRNSKKHRKGSTKENKNKDERSKSQLFNETDAKSVEFSGYTMGRRAPQSDRFMQERAIPTGVVGVDKSVKLLSSPSQHQESKPYTILRPSQDYYKEQVHLPPISHHSHHRYQHQPYEYYQTPADYYNFGQLSYPYPVQQEYQSPHHHHHHIHHHKHHHRHHTHKKEVETYDPRWWYMPVNSVHAPKPKRTPEYHYVPPKWYESSSKQSRDSMLSQEPILPPRKYVDCRCEMCKPSRETPRGSKWIVNE